jgi:SAM-dependent methyltransferase
MWAADHSVLRSTGVTAFLGIVYSMIGAFLILPPVLGWLEKRRQAQAFAGGTLRERVRRRYRCMEAYPRLFARFKLRCDPMFVELERIFQSSDGIKTILDIGSGYGVPASWLLERFAGAGLHGIEPSAERVRVASIAVGARGAIRQGLAPELPDAIHPADLSMMIDMVHYLPDDALAITFEGLRQRMRPGGRLVVRAAVVPKRRFPWAWLYQNALLRVSGVPVYYRPVERLQKMIVQAGFQAEPPSPSGRDEELVWLFGRKA